MLPMIHTIILTYSSALAFICNSVCITLPESEFLASLGDLLWRNECQQDDSKRLYPQYRVGQLVFGLREAPVKPSKPLRNEGSTCKTSSYFRRKNSSNKHVFNLFSTFSYV